LLAKIELTLCSMHVGNILDFSQAEAGLVELAQEPFNVSDTLEAALDMVWPLASSKKITLSHQISPILRKTEVIGDALRLRQILVHLLNNGAKFTHAGTVEALVNAEELPSGELDICFQVGHGHLCLCCCVHRLCIIYRTRANYMDGMGRLNNKW
jgi:signal transduction histidine kinase